MRGKFVWADGVLKTGEGMENTKARPLHHIHLLEALEAEGKITLPAKNFLGGTYRLEPNSDNISGRIIHQFGRTPDLEEILTMIKSRKEKFARYDYAATMEYLSTS